MNKTTLCFIHILLLYKPTSYVISKCIETVKIIVMK